ncbi:ATP-binding cassette sub-family A member 2-like isoform X2 [Cylas formicarius]|uniref:ATP-binding cassette sub-family A member 2-like isoform X2 n=1 Tax=Cylas formicarius TaxID=197179 RepID=UPI002958CD19|nr:ATP-binding cassette sub-family A member 2-like isoform X2 [Cylas formicarius]
MSLLQLKVVLWKNLIIRRRHYFLTLCEALVPILLFLLIAYGRSKISGLNKTEVSDVTYNEKIEINPTFQSINAESLVLYTPNDFYFEDIMHRMQEKLELVNNNIQGFASVSDLLQDYAKNVNSTVISIIFKPHNNGTTLDYTVRCHEQFFSWSTEKLYISPYRFSPGVGSIYLWKGFLTLQAALDVSFIEKSGGNKLNVKFNTLEFPYPPYKSDSGLISLFMDFLPLITLFSFIFVCPAVLKRVVEEKYSGIKELMKMVGMRSWMLWLGWFLYSIIPMILSVAVIVFLMKVEIFGSGYPLIEYTDGTILFVFLLLYCVAATVFCFFISTFFTKPTLATLIGLLVWILSYFIPKYLLGTDGTTPRLTKTLLLLFPNMGLYYGYATIAVFEERELGVQWSNWQKPSSDSSNDITMLNVCVMLVVDTLIYALLTHYVDLVNPGKYGVRESYFFPLNPLKKMIRNYFNKVNHRSDVESVHLEHFESGRGLKKGIEVIGLTKRFSRKVAVNCLSMEIYQDQITVLLGHNGAGKSTTMGMITGMISKTAGQILMNGHCVNSRSQLTETIGLCPQHNLLFNDLTVFEHLKFFAMLKGRSSAEAEEEINDLLQKLNLEGKANSLAHTLSGGMKRKLCLGMAIVGGSKILILDEPSSGMDPESRRHLWDLLLGWRNKKTILITTHFMEEADALGDWIAIMNDGRLRCFGTPMFLKRKYETGYHLSLLLQDTRDDGDTVLQIKTHLERFVPEAKCKSVDGNEMVFVLPFGINYKELFEFLEEHKDEFKIEKISMTTTTLEDVFLNTNKTEEGKAKAESDNESLCSSAQGDTNYYLTFRALREKRLYFFKKKYLTYLVPFLTSLVFLILCIYLGESVTHSSISDGPLLKMKLDTYGRTRVVFNATYDSEVARIAQHYRRLVFAAGSELAEVNDTSQAVINEGINNIAFYRRHMVVGAELKSGSAGGIETVALYNNLALHAAPISLNLITNALAKSRLGPQYSISMSNWPLERIRDTNSPKELSEVQLGLLWLVILPIGVLFFLGSFIFFPHMELSTNFTQLQFMCGVSPFLYWLVNYACDFALFATFALVMAMFNLIWTPFRGFEEMVALFLLLVLYGASGIPFAYLFSRKKSSSGAFAVFIISGLILGVTLTMIVIVLNESGDEHYMRMGRVFEAIFLTFSPQFVITYFGVAYSRKAINNYNLAHMPREKLNAVCFNDPNPCCYAGSSSSESCARYKQYWGVFGADFAYVLLGAAIYFLVNVALHSYWYKKRKNDVVQGWYSLKNIIQGTASSERCSELEKLCLDETGDDGNEMGTLRVKKLKKRYSGRDVVRNVHFNLRKGECMGILGVNGAGKTTTFRMLTREEVKDEGSIVADGRINVDQNEYLKRLGYCPQTDALNYALTGREILRIMAMLRGIKQPEQEVKNFLNIFDLDAVADVPCGYYSGGNKRKLSFAVAIIGLPDFVLLDEPTNGVDPSTRRKFWSLINTIKKKKNTSFILTSHSMVECEALCNDLKIMKQGTIERQGTISKLKEEIGGFSIKLKLKHGQTETLAARDRDEVDGLVGQQEAPQRRSVEELKADLMKRYSGQIKDEHSGLIHYYIESRTKRWSDLFREVEELKSAYPELIEDYSISEASLEDVFLTVARS